MAITIEKIDATIVEVKRFVAAASAEKKAIRQRDNPVTWGPNCPLETGSVRRASMDLTRSLAKLRKA